MIELKGTEKEVELASIIRFRQMVDLNKARAFFTKKKCRSAEMMTAKEAVLSGIDGMIANPDAKWWIATKDVKWTPKYLAESFIPVPRAARKMAAGSGVGSKIGAAVILAVIAIGIVRCVSAVSNMPDPGAELAKAGEGSLPLTQADTLALLGAYSGDTSLPDDNIVCNVLNHRHLNRARVYYWLDKTSEALFQQAAEETNGLKSQVDKKLADKMMGVMAAVNGDHMANCGPAK